MAPALTSTIYHEPSTLGNILSIAPSAEKTTPLQDSKGSKTNSNSRALSATAAHPQTRYAIIDSKTPSIQPDYLQSSPYPDPLHLLDLNRLPPASRLFACALASLTAIRADYATAPYDQVFNWDHVMYVLRCLSAAENFQFPATSFYTVVFQSKLKAEVDKELLFQLDSMSHQEAVASGGLLKYWFGSPDVERRNLATCEFALLISFRPSFSQ